MNPVDRPRITCIHADEGLCPQCVLEALEDPVAYWEFGNHPEGIKRWERLVKEMDEFYADDTSEAQPEPEETGEM